MIDRRRLLLQSLGTLGLASIATPAWPAPPKWPSFKVRARRVMCGGHAGTPST